MNMGGMHHGKAGTDIRDGGMQGMEMRDGGMRGMGMRDGGMPGMETRDGGMRDGGSPADGGMKHDMPGMKMEHEP